jgi:hypothetical protein
MRLSKQEFVNAIEKYKAMEQCWNALYEATHCQIFESPQYECVMQYFRFISDMCDIPNHEDDMLSYWVFELDCGAKWHPGCVTDENDNDIKVQTAEDVYEYLVNTYTERVENCE